jgi:chromosome segregation ATPase
MQKLSNEEVNTVKAFIGNYNELFKKITLMEKELESLSIRKDSILQKLNSLNDEIHVIRKKEKEYNDHLVNKYGSFKLNMETFEIEIA